MKRTSFLCGGILAVISASTLVQATPTWTYYDLGKGNTFSGIRRTSTMSTGYIVGYSGTTPVYWTYNSTGILTGPITIPSMPSSSGNVAVYDVSSDGTIVGSGEITGGPPYQAGFTWKLPTLANPATNIGKLIFPYSINNTDVIGGWDDNVNKGWFAGNTISDGTTPGTYPPGFICVNDKNDAICSIQYANSPNPYYASVYKGGSDAAFLTTWTKIVPNTATIPIVINNNDEILSQITDSSGFNQGTVGPASNSAQYKIGVNDVNHSTTVTWMNNTNNVTGSYFKMNPLTATHAFWSDTAGNLIDLSTSVTLPAGTTLVTGVRISDHGTSGAGDIVGNSLVTVNHAQENHGFLLVAG